MEDTAKSNEWPRWHFGPNGKEGVFDCADDVPQGWVTHPSLVKEAKPAPTPAAAKPPVTPPAAPVVPAAGAPAASKAGRPKTPLGLARDAYKAAFGKGATPKMTIDDINAAIAAKPADKALDL
jgi:hypothetical protein